MKIKVHYIDVFVCSLYLFVVSNNFFTILFSSESSAEDENTGVGIMLVLSIFLYLYLIYKILIRHKFYVRIFLENRLILSLIILTFISSLWSDSFSNTLIQSTWHLLTIFFAMHIAKRYSTLQVTKMILFTLIAAGLLSLIFYVAAPSIGKHIGDVHDGAMKGIFGQKNALGRHMALGTILSLYLYYLYRTKTYLLFFITFLVIVILSRSTTSIILILFSLVLIPLLNTILSNRNLIFQKILLCLLFLMLFTVMFTELIGFDFESFGKDDSLTGRVPLWATLLEYIDSRPILGYGYNSFWNGISGLGTEVWLQVKWQPYSAHNGFIDVLLQLGYVGLSIILLMIFTSLRNSIALIKTSKVNYIFIIIFLIFIVLNITESFFLRKNYFLWVVFIIYFIQSNSLTNFNTDGQQLKSNYR